jgi:ribonucleoside-diphosphate reductase alpha chain
VAPRDEVADDQESSARYDDFRDSIDSAAARPASTKLESRGFTRTPTEPLQTVAKAAVAEVPLAVIAEAKPRAEALAALGASTSNVSAVQMARRRGYEGESCSTCGNFTLVRNCTCLKCDSCGSTSGCS